MFSVQCSYAEADIFLLQCKFSECERFQIHHINLQCCCVSFHSLFLQTDGWLIMNLEYKKQIIHCHAYFDFLCMCLLSALLCALGFSLFNFFMFSLSYSSHNNPNCIVLILSSGFSSFVVDECVKVCAFI